MLGRSVWWGSAGLLWMSSILLAQGSPGSRETLLLRTPAVSEKAIAFVWAGDLWVTDLEGEDKGEARRLTVHPGVESDPCFSPDGEWVAFSGNYDGNQDVYVVSVRGGSPRRLTYHPASDVARGWTPDGRRVLFSSDRDAYSYFHRFFTVAKEGGFPDALEIPMGFRAAYSPDGKSLAYTPLPDPFLTWKRYRGGATPPIWIFDFATREVTSVPHERASDSWPVWLGRTLYFLSDRAGTMNVFSWELGARQVRQLTRHADFDVRSLSGRGNLLVYEQGGRLHRLDVRGGSSRPLPIRLDPDLPSVRPHFAPARTFQSAAISPTGARAVFEVRGELITLPAEKGDARNLTRTPGVHERDPAWSPDGRRIAYLSDQGGEYHLRILDQRGLEAPRVISLGDPTFYYSPKWSPDGKKIAYTDKRLNLFVLDLQKGKPVKVDSDTFDNPERTLDPSWSPDSRWIAYTKRLDNQLRAVFVYDVAAGKARQITDGRSDAVSAVFAPDGKHLYFAASTNYGLNTGWLDLSSLDQPVLRDLYVAVLTKDTPSPFAPESDDEPEPELDARRVVAAAEGELTAPVTIDFDQLDQRILALPVSSGDYANLQIGADGTLYFLAQEPGAEAGGGTLYRFDFGDREATPVLKGLLDYWLSRDGGRLLYEAAENKVGILDTAELKEAGQEIADGALPLGEVQVWVEPRAEWNEMFEEAWRIERDFFYDAGLHGVDWPAVQRKYRPFLAHLGHRADLDYVLSEMLGELSVGHGYITPGDEPQEAAVPVGLLGADYRIENGRYRIARIYSGENWNPELKAPLTAPGVDVKAGDYLLSVNGQPLTPPTNLYSLFANTAGKQTVLTVSARVPGEKPDKADGVRRVTVVPIEDEGALRQRAWIEANRRKVDAATGGRVAYVYLPDTGSEGYSSFIRYFFSQLDKQAVILDERFNGGGQVADFIVDMLNRPLLGNWATREGKGFTSPTAAIFGPKALIVNEYAVSGGDALPYFFRQRGLGKLIGKRTTGALIGVYDYPELLDGGTITAPRLAFYSAEGKWAIENEGVAPDIEVEMTPKRVIEGQDPQLEKAIEVVLKELEQNPVPQPPRPAPRRLERND